MRRSLGRHVTLALACIVIPAAQAIAQVATQVSAATPSTSASRGDPKKALTLADYGRWNRITQTAISPDGKWMSYAYQPNDGDVTLYVKELDGSKVYTIAAGRAARRRVAEAVAGSAEAARQRRSSPTIRASSATM